MKKYSKYLKIFFSLILTVALFLVSAVNATAEDNTQPTTEPFKSMVKNITVQDGSFTTGFKSGNYTYSVYFDSFKENLKVNVELNDSRFISTVKGNTRLDRGIDNDVIIYVTDPNGEYEDEKYTLNIFFTANGLSYLDVENGIFSPQFDKFHTTYYAILENNINTFEAAGVNWKTVHKDTVVEVECIDELNEDGSLKEGERTDYRLVVTEADGTIVNYKLRLYRKASMVSAINENALLSSIKINGGAVEVKSFKQNQSFYDVMVPSSIKQLDVQAYPVDRSDITEVIGNTVMNDNSPIYITIKVTSDKYQTSSYYTLRCQYDTLTHTQKHTDLQMISYVAIAVFVCIILGILSTLAIKNKKTKGNETVEEVEKSEYKQ